MLFYFLFFWFFLIPHYSSSLFLSSLQAFSQSYCLEKGEGSTWPRKEKRQRFSSESGWAFFMMHDCWTTVRRRALSLIYYVANHNLTKVTNAVKDPPKTAKDQRLSPFFASRHHNYDYTSSSCKSVATFAVVPQNRDYRTRRRPKSLRNLLSNAYLPHDDYYRSKHPYAYFPPSDHESDHECRRKCHSRFGAVSKATTNQLQQPACYLRHRCPGGCLQFRSGLQLSPQPK
jgi:hypothetical protein